MNDLPELPRKNKRIEANVDGLVLEWLKDNWPKSFALEVKIRGGKILPHQRVSLAKVKKGNFAYKIPDMGRQNPFDAFCLKDADALLCVVDGRSVECSVNDTHTVAFRI